MADLTQTAANVHIYDKDVSTRILKAGGTITQGMPVYKASDGDYEPADADAANTAAAAAIALTPASSGEYFVALTKGNVDVGATLVVGTTYVVSTTAGAIAPQADLGSGDYVTVLGIATTTSTLNLNINVSAVAIA